MRKVVNYDEVAPTFNGRYAVNPLPGVAQHLRALAQAAGGGRLLEVGCGTGRWLAEFQPLARQITGFDFSRGMLRQAQQRGLPQVALAQGQAGELPFATGSLDLLYCVNALHHFPRQEAFITEAHRLLRPGGVLSVVGMDPRAGRARWYLYDYFPETLPADLERFPSAGTLIDWMAAGFAMAGLQRVERMGATQTGRAVLADPLLQKNGTSQLTLLSDEAYAAGLARLKRDLDEAEARGETLLFETDIWMTAVVAVR